MAHCTALKIPWIALVAVIAALAALAMAVPAEAEVRTLVADETSYAAGSSMVLTGTGNQARELVQLKIEAPDGTVVDCAVVDYCASVVSKSNNDFEFSAISVDAAFTATGTYRLLAHSGSQGQDDAKVLLVSKSGSTVSVLGGVLEIRDISRQTVNALSELTFTARIEGSSTGITFSLTGNIPDGARITSGGEFSWTPIPSEAQSRSYEVTIVATGQGQTAEKTVEIRVRDPTTVSNTGVTLVEPNPSSKTLFSSTESITFTGRIAGSSGVLVRLSIYSPGSSSDAVAVVSKNTESGGAFTMQAIPVSTTFTSSGDYTLKAYTTAQGIDNAYTAILNYANNQVEYRGSSFALVDVPRQETVAGSRVAFQIRPVDSSFTNIDYSLTGSRVSGASITDNAGIFTWTPRAADAGTASSPTEHTITIRAEVGSGSSRQTATKDVVIAVGPAPTSATPTGTGGTGETGTTQTPATPAADTDSRVLTIRTDATSYSQDDQIVFSGTTEGAAAREIVTVVIQPPSGSSQLRSGLAGTDNAFTLSGVNVRDSFGRAGIYTIKAFTNDQGAANAATIKMEYENRRASLYFESPLTISSIPRQTVEVGSRLTFTVTPTDSSYTGLTWSLGGPTLEGARISSSGVFEWTPQTLRNAQGESFTINVMATDGQQNAGASVTISVTPRAPEPEPEPEPEPKPAPAPEPKAAEPEPKDPAPDPLAAKRTQFLATVQGASPQSLIDRYENEDGYKTWFDANFEGLDIREALGVKLATPPAPSGPDPRFASSMTPGTDPQTYVDRYNDEPAYRAWFDANFEGLTIEQAVGIAPEPEAPAPAAPAEPDPRFASSMTPGTDPQTYVDRYNDEPAYRAWFDANFEGLTIEQAVGLSTPKTAAPAPAATPAPEPDPDPDPKFVPFMTSGDDPQTYVDRYNDEPAYKTWFDANFEGLTIQQAAGLGSSQSAAPATPPAPEPDPDPDPAFVPYMTDGDDPFTYVHRYNTDPPYAEWFDASFPDLTIQQATGYVTPKVQPCVPGTVMVDGACEPVKSTPVPKPSVGGCLIATAAYGTELAPQVQALREVRDSTLLSTASGSAFMDAFNGIYYSFSPTVADWERQSPELRAAIRAAITPMVASLSIMSLADGGSESDVLALGIAVIALNVGMYVAAPAGAAIAARRVLGPRARSLVRKVGFEPTNP